MEHYHLHAFAHCFDPPSASIAVGPLLAASLFTMSSSIRCSVTHSEQESGDEEYEKRQTV